MLNIKHSLLLLSLFVTSSALGTQPLLKIGDRVTMLGGTFVERMQIHGHFETEIRARLQGDIQIKNLGWAGDNVLGESRAVFGNVEKGMERLINDMRLTNPTVIIIFYGGNEAHKGSAGIENFRVNLQALIKQLATFNARLILVGPRPYENLGPPLPSPQSYNSGLTSYRDVLRSEAERIDAPFIDLATLEPLVSGEVLRPSVQDGNVEEQLPTGLTSNGVHLTSNGYRTLAPAFASALGLNRIELSVVIDGDDIDAKGLNGISFVRNGEVIELAGTPEQLPTPSSSRLDAPQFDLKLKLGELPAGKYRVYVTNSNGVSLRVLSQTQLVKGVRLSIPIDDSYKELLHTITMKNMMFFHRHRPQNETYLFLFRKHEQGNNAVEIPQFDPLVVDLDKRIYDLCKPRRFKLSIEPIQ